MTRRPPVAQHGWALYAHPLFLDQLETLITEVEAHRGRDPVGYRSTNAAKRLAAIRRLILEVIPEDPTRAEYRQGTTLGDVHTHWFRATFFQQYRLFFRYHSAARIIVYGWVNDSTTKRAFGSSTDAYRVFRSMLDSGHPPTDWDALISQASALEDSGTVAPPHAVD